MKRFIVLCLMQAFFFCGIASAELTDAEKSQMRTFASGVKAFYDVQRQLVAAMAYTGGNAAYAEINEAVHTHYLAEGHLVDVFWKLLELPNWEVTLVGTPQLPPYDDWLAAQRVRPRAEKLVEAWESVDALQGRLLELSGLVSAGLVKEPGNAALASIKNTYLPSAVAKLNPSRALAWADPLPSYWPTIVGPHGDYDEAQWRHDKSAHYLSLAGMRGWEAYQGKGRNAATAVLKNMQERSNISVILMQGILRNANVALSGEPSDRVSLAFEVMMLDLESLAEKFWNIQNQLLTSILINPSGIAQAMSIAGDAWRHMDRGVWQMLVIE